MSKKSKTTSSLIASNKKANHDYYLEQRFEAGLVLEGWEVKSIRQGQVQLRDSYVLLKRGEAFLIGVHISPLNTVSTHIHPVPDRDRKLLLHEKELNCLRVSKEREGYTIVPVNLHWTHNRVKAEIALAKGKKQFDKRDTEKDRDWGRQKQRLLKNT